MRSAPDPLAARLILAFNHYFKHFSQLPLITTFLDISLALHQNRETTRFLVIGNGIVQIQSRRIRTRGILEREHSVVFDVVEQAKGLLKFGLGLARETDDDIGGQADFAPGGFYPGNPLEVLLPGVETLHGVEHARGAALYGKVHVVAESGHGLDGLHNILTEVSGMRSGEANPLYA